MTDKSESKDAKSATDWDGQPDPITKHGGDWFWGDDPPPEAGPQVDAKAVSKEAKKA